MPGRLPGRCYGRWTVDCGSSTESRRTVRRSTGPLPSAERLVSGASTAAPALTLPAKGRALTLPNFLLLLFSVGTAATGQILLKYGMRGVAEITAKDGGNVLLKAAGSPWVWGGPMQNQEDTKVRRSDRRWEPSGGDSV